MLDSNSIAKRDQATGLSLEGLLTENLKHPNIVRTMAWAVINGHVSALPIPYILNRSNKTLNSLWGFVTSV